MTSLPAKVWEFDEILAKIGLPTLNPVRRMGWNTYRRFLQRELLKNGEVAVREWGGNISYWRIPYPGLYLPETGQVW